MQKAVKYTIFRTGWGYFGLAGNEFALLRTHLPGPDPKKIKCELLKNSPLVNRPSRIQNPESSIELDKTLFKTLQEQIIAYFEGSCVDFSRDTPIVLDGFSLFAKRILTACMDIRFGQTISYGQLAKKIGRAAAYRAVGSTLARNPLPLIIPCHRVIRSDGQVGGFSAPGGVTLKKRLLLHEQNALR